MPYIPQADRRSIEAQILSSNISVGDLNYSISKLLHEWLEIVGVNYTHTNAAIGVLECAKLELYRQIAAPMRTKRSSKMV